MGAASSDLPLFVWLQKRTIASRPNCIYIQQAVYSKSCCWPSKKMEAGWQEPYGLHCTALHCQLLSVSASSPLRSEPIRAI